MPFGVPVVPEENITTSGVLKGTCSNLRDDLGALLTNVSILVLL